MHVGFRSWRDTGITWLALACVDVAKMQRPAGHDHISTTMGYVKTAEDVTGTIGAPFPPLPVCLLSPDAVDVKKASDWAKRRYRSLDGGKTSAERASPGGTDHSGSIEIAAFSAADAVRVDLCYVA
jgi:hypothetical protein